MRLISGSEQMPQGDHRSRGVVLRRRGSSSASWDILLFLSGFGAIWVNAPGADGAKNRFGAGTEPMIWGEFRLYQSPKRLYLKGVEVREHFWGIRKSQRALTTAVKWLGAIAANLPAGCESDSLLSLLWGSMKHLSAGLSPLLADARFVFRWCGIWGTAPSLEECALCGAALDSPSGSVHLTSAGLVCPRCRRSSESGSIAFYKSISSNTLQEFRQAALLPKDSFFAWANERKASAPDEIKDCTAWLYGLLRC